MVMRRMRAGIPEGAVAFAAGARAVSGRDWRLVAASLKLLGYGDVDPVALEKAVSTWSLSRLQKIRAGARGKQLVIATRSTGLPS